MWHCVYAYFVVIFTSLCVVMGKTVCYLCQIIVILASFKYMNIDTVYVRTYVASKRRLL